MPINENIEEEFGTKEAAAAEDQRRCEDLELVMAALSDGPTGTSAYLNRVNDIRSAIKTNAVKLDPAEINELIKLLSMGATCKVAMPTLASALEMRSTRLDFCRALEPLFDATGGCERWKVATVSDLTFGLMPCELLRTRAKDFIRMLRADFRRIGVCNVDGPLVGVLQCKWNMDGRSFPTRARFIGPDLKIDALLRLNDMRGAARPSCATAPVEAFSITHGAGLARYILDGFSLQRPPLRADSRKTPVRLCHRYNELFRVLQLIWMHRQTLPDFMLLQNIWSPEGGGSEEGLDLFYEIHRTSLASVSTLERLRNIWAEEAQLAP